MQWINGWQAFLLEEMKKKAVTDLSFLWSIESKRQCFWEDHKKVFLCVHFGYLFCLPASADKCCIFWYVSDAFYMSWYFFKERLNSAHVKNRESSAFSFKPLCTWWARITSWTEFSFHTMVQRISLYFSTAWVIFNAKNISKKYKC